MHAWSTMHVGDETASASAPGTSVRAWCSMIALLLFLWWGGREEKETKKPSPGTKKKGNTIQCYNSARDGLLRHLQCDCRRRGEANWHHPGGTLRGHSDLRNPHQKGSTHCTKSSEGPLLRIIGMAHVSINSTRKSATSRKRFWEGASTPRIGGGSRGAPPISPRGYRRGQ